MTPQQDFIYEYSYHDLFDYATQLAEKMDVSFANNEVLFPDSTAEGYCRVFKVNDYLSYMVMQYKARQAMILRRIPTEQSHITVSFRNFSLVKSDTPLSSSPDIDTSHSSLGTIQCKSTRLPELLTIEPGFEVKVIVVLLKEGWLYNILRDSECKEKFARYLLNKESSLYLRKEFFSPKQLKLFEKVFSGSSCFQAKDVFYVSRVMHLLESFLMEVITKEDPESPFIIASHEDILMLKKAEQYMNDHLLEPFPGVDVLSRMCCMSRTKFINLFQKVYGLSSYEYSQKKRLAIAYDYLKSGKHSVCDVAQKIGYAGGNNFNVAFKKEFGVLPSEMLDKLRAPEPSVN